MSHIYIARSPQADTFERKIEICQRSYDLLVQEAGYNPTDIIFDPNVLTIGTGLEEHSKYGKDFIHTVEWIKVWEYMVFISFSSCVGLGLLYLRCFDTFQFSRINALDTLLTYIIEVLLS